MDQLQGRYTKAFTVKTQSALWKYTLICINHVDLDLRSFVGSLTNSLVPNQNTVRFKLVLTSWLCMTKVQENSVKVGINPEILKNRECRKSC